MYVDWYWIQILSRPVAMLTIDSFVFFSSLNDPLIHHLARHSMDGLMQKGTSFALKIVVLSRQPIHAQKEYQMFFFKKKNHIVMGFLTC